jgi:hypothetical protein
VGGVLTEDDRLFWLLPEPEQEVYDSGPRNEDEFGCSELLRVQRRRFTCPIILKNLIGLSAKSRPGPRVSNDFVPAPIISVKEHDLDIDGSGFWRRLRQFDLPVFILAFEYFHQKAILHNSQCLVYISSPPDRIDFHSRISVIGEPNKDEQSKLNRREGKEPWSRLRKTTVIMLVIRGRRV